MYTKKQWLIVGVGAVILLIILVVSNYYHKKGYSDYESQMNQRIGKSMEDERHNIDNLIKKYQGDPTITNALDLEAKYDIVERGGDKQEMYEFAGAIATAYLAAEDEYSYKKWKDKQAELKKNIDD